MKRRQRFSGCTLDRAALLRRDSAWIEARLNNEKSRFLPLWRNRNLIAGRAEARLEFLPHAAVVDLLGRSCEQVLLGMDGERAYFALDLSPLGEEEAAGFAGTGEFSDLRHVAAAMDGDAAALAAYARALLRWHRHSRFCGYCGGETISLLGGQRRRCTDAACGREHYPRTDPAVIMLVVQQPDRGRQARCLLASHHRSAMGSYSTLAGFIEPGESLEDAVAREVWEEVGLRVEAVCYRGSQPWPFPSNVMLGFHAYTQQTDLEVDSEELRDARWFTSDALAGFGEWGDEGASCKLPPHDSIARDLIETWRREVTGEQGR